MFIDALMEGIAEKHGLTLDQPITSYIRYSKKKHGR